MFWYRTRPSAFAAGAIMAAAVAAMLALAPLNAAAQSELKGTTLGTTNAEITASLTALGYVVEEFEREHGMIEAEAAKDGNEYEIHIDPATGVVKSVELDD